MIDLPEVECPEPVEGHAYVYILQCSNGSYYIGISDCVESRLKRHMSNAGAQHTHIHKPFRLVYTEGPMERDDAARRELHLKKWSHAKKEALIQQDYSELKTLSRSRISIDNN